MDGWMNEWVNKTKLSRNKTNIKIITNAKQSLFSNKLFLLLFLLLYFIQWRIFYCASHRNDTRCFNYINILRLGTLNNNKINIFSN